MIHPFKTILTTSCDLIETEIKGRQRRNKTRLNDNTEKEG